MDSSCWVCTVDWQVGVVDGAAERLVRVPELVGERLRGPLGCLALLSLLKATGAGFDYQARSLWCSTPLVSPSLSFLLHTATGVSFVCVRPRPCICGTR